MPVDTVAYKRVCVALIQCLTTSVVSAQCIDCPCSVGSPSEIKGVLF